MKSLLKKTFLLSAFLSSSLIINAQHLKIGIQPGIGSYKMSELKDLNKYVANNVLHPKTISNYPCYYYYQPVISLEFRYISVGFLYSFHSTGSRISIKDYSGEYRFDTKIKGKTFGIIVGGTLNPDKKIKFSLYSEIGLLQSNLNLNEYFRVNNMQMVDNNYYFNSKNYYVEPGGKISYTFSFICFEMNFGYFKQFGNGYFEGKKGMKLTLDDKNIQPDWSGLRIGFSILLDFKLSEEDDE